MLERLRAPICIALFWSSFFYLYGYRNEGIFHLDAVYLAQTVESMFAGGPWDTGWRFGAVLTNAVLYIPFWLLGESAEFVTIFSSILFHALSVSTLFLFLARYSDDVLFATLAAGLFGLAPMYVIPNTFGKEYGLAVFLVTLSWMLIDRAKVQNDQPLAALAALCFTFSFIVREAMPLLGPINLYILLDPRIEDGRLTTDPRGWRLSRAVIAGFAVGVILAWSTSYRTIVVMHASNPTTMTRFVGILSPVLPVAARGLVQFLSIEVLALAAGGLWVGLMRREYRRVLVLAGGLVSTILFFGNMSTYSPRYLDLCAMGLMMLAALSLASLLRLGFSAPPDGGDRRHWRLAVGLVAMGATMGCAARLVAAANPMLVVRRTFNGPKRFAQFVGRMTEPNSVIIAQDDRRFLEYYGHRTVSSYPIGDSARVAAWLTTLEQTLAAGPVYVVESAFNYDPDQSVRRALLDRFSFQEVGHNPWEAYHHAERGFQMAEHRLWRMGRKGDSANRPSSPSTGP